jgi:hypothetical protein
MNMMTLAILIAPLPLMLLLAGSGIVRQPRYAPIDRRGGSRPDPRRSGCR